MTAFFVWLVRTIGIGGCACLILYVYDWGIPGLDRVPYLSSIPFVGDLTTGRAHTYAADQVKLAIADTVTRFERDALQARLNKQQRDLEIAQAASARAQERADATDLAKQAADERNRQLEAQAKQAGVGATWTKEELEWDARH